jgi:nucleoside-diphosphate-sugar epimerase
MNLKQLDAFNADINEMLAGGNISRLEFLKNKQIFISGASGFVGKWVIGFINHLNEKHNFNVQVIAQSRRIAAAAAEHPEIFNNKNVKQIQGDIKNISEIDRDVSYVIHLAGTPDNREHASDPVRVMNDIITGTNQILNASTRLDNLANFLQYSSGLIYGMQPYSSENIKEESFYGLSCSSLNSTYAEAKRAAESMAQSYRSSFKIPLTVLRPFAFIGPYQSLERPWAINNFIRDGLASQPIRIIGDEETVRSYMYPTEMAFWTLLALSNKTSGASFNIGSDDGKSLRATAQIVDQNFDGKSGIVSTVPVHSGLLTKFVPSINKFESTFNVKLKIDTKTAIEKSIRWYRLGR